MWQEHRDQHQQLEGATEVSPSETPLHRITAQTQERKRHPPQRPHRDDNDVGERAKRAPTIVRLGLSNINAGRRRLRMHHE